ncbi:MAG: leucine--tRNA ligase [Candidatus Pacebacteria bacterium]|nr:leucine--tRNA ligase [Candidatus Paceibacterota bacterium]
MKTYDHTKIEKKWQEAWSKSKIYETKDSVSDTSSAAAKKENFYLLVEFPYPSGNLHVGHWYSFAVPDILARTLKMEGKNVLYPIGFDAFGLPAENAAIKNKVNPREWTESNMAYMREQLRSMGASFDWSREVVTCHPDYYRWTQWLFLQLFKANLAYRKETMVNWCPNDKTVLANEQVVDGKCERCGHEVVQKEMLQWNIKITEYADRLVDDLEKLDWPEPIKESQRNWIGKSEGAEIDFSLDFGEEKVNARTDADGKRAHITVFTTRPDTLFGATYLVLAPEHPWVTLTLQHKAILKNNEEVAVYVEQTSKKTELERQQETKEKTGVKLEGVVAVNPATGEKIPLYVADYVLAGYGTGAIMAVPAHDERDRAFAEKFGLPIREVVSDDRKLMHSGEYDDLSIEEGKKKITEVFGRRKTTYKLRDWIVSRQRYWGVPIPIIHCPSCGSVAVPDNQLPVLLPETDDYLPDGKGKSPLAKVESFVQVKCPQCGGDAQRETDTFDTFIDSSWYFLRYADPKNEKEFAAKDRQALWMPIDLYSGGAEHTTMHLLYSRFWHKALFDQGLVADSEPYLRRMNRGIILGPDGQKMSKSKGNVIDPDDVVRRLGADTVRMYLAFIGPYNEVASYPWNPDGVVGVRRFLERLWRAQELVVESDKLDDKSYSIIDRELHRTIKKVGEDAKQLKFNTAISQMMIFLNTIEKEKQIGKAQWETLLKLLAPFAPHMAEELWHESGRETSIHAESWPSFDPKLLVSEEGVIAIQIDGKMRGEITIASDSPKDAVEAAAREKVAARLEGKTITRTIVVPNRLVNFVTA